MRKTAVFLFVLVFCCFLLGCRDSSSRRGAQPSEYTGVTSQAKISEDTVKDLATQNFTKMQGSTDLSTSIPNLPMMGMVSEGGGTLSAGSFALFLSTSVLELIQAHDTSAQGNALYLGAVMEESYTEACSGGGKIYVDESFRDRSDTITGSMTIDFDNCREDGILLDGYVTADVTVKCKDHDCYYFTATGDIHFDDLIASGDAGTQTISGSVRMESDQTDDNYSFISMRINMVTTEDTGKTHWLDDMVIEHGQDYRYNGALTVGMNGRFYDHDHGYVDIDTETPFKYYDNNIYPSQGEYVMKGADNTRARFICIDNQIYRLLADTNGDGVDDYNSGALYWSDLY